MSKRMMLLVYCVSGHESEQRSIHAELEQGKELYLWQKYS